MMQKMRRPLALFCALFMCVTMLSGIVLPQLAETALAVEDTDPYAATEVHTEVAKVVDGKITIITGDNDTPGDETDDPKVEIVVPSEFASDEILIADDRLFFFDVTWTPDKLDIDGNVGDYFFCRYGNDAEGSAWGNGKVYLLRWAVNAFGKTNLDDVLGNITDLKGDTIVTENTYTGWRNMLNKLRHIIPTVGGDNNYYVMLLPGSFGNSTGSSGKTKEVQFATAEVDGETVKATDLTQKDYTNVYFYGPQAGVNPTAGVVGNTTLSNGRSVSTNTEFVFGSTFWGPYNAVWHFDGIAQSGTCRVNIDEAMHGGGMYMTNVVAKLNSAENAFWSIGSSTASEMPYVFHVTDSYFYGNKTLTSGSNNYVRANDFLLSGCVFKDWVVSASNNTGHIRIGSALSDALDTAFLGEYRNSANVEIRNNTFDNWQAYRLFSIYGNSYSDCKDPKMVIDGNRFTDIGVDDGTATSYFLCACVDDKASPISMPINITNNYIAFDKTATKTFATLFVYDISNAASLLNVKNNTIVADVANATDYRDTTTSKTANVLDMSGNLFLDYEGNVRAVYGKHTGTDYADVLSDTYISDEFSGGVKELFTVQETTQDLLVTNSSINVMLKTADDKGKDHLTGSVTVLPKDGVTYQTKNIFTFKDEDVKLLGFYKDEACTQPVSSFTKGFGTLYAKAQYKAGKTTATVVYTITEPTAYHVVAPNSETSYDFNGTTYTADNAIFYTTIADAVSAAAATDVVLLMPGSYSGLTIKKTTAIIGPKTWVSASNGTTNAIATGRSLDGSDEAIIGAITVTTDDADYFTIAGVAGANVTAKASGVTVQRLAFVNVHDVCFTRTSDTIVLGSRARNRTESAAADVHLWLDDSHLTVTTGANQWIDAASNYMHVTDSTLVKNGSSQSIYTVPVPTVSMAYTPAVASLIVENCVIEETSTATQYMITYNPAYYTTQPKVVDACDGVKNGSAMIFRNNIFNTAALLTPFRVMGAATGSHTVVITGNQFNRAASNSKALLDNYGDNTAYAFNATVENNVIINYTRPWLFNDSEDPAKDTLEMSVNVDENYYGTSDGDVQIISGGHGYVKDAFTYYVDPDMTATNKDLALTDKNFESAEITNTNSFADWSMAVTMNVADGKTYKLADFTTEKGEVTAVTNAEGTSVFDVDGNYTPADGDVLKATVSYTNDSNFTYTNAWTVDVTTTEGAWADYGLAPTADDVHTVEDTEEGGEPTTQTYVDLTIQDAYAGRDGGNKYGLVFVAPDFTTFAHKTYEGAVADSTGDKFSSVATTGDDNTEDDAGDNVVLDSEDIFYAKMPTTGIIYKLAYAVTAANLEHTATNYFGTLVFFPGTYTSSDIWYAATPTALFYHTGKNASNLPIGKLKNGNGNLAYGSTEFRLIGAQAGVAASDMLNNGLSASRGTNETIFSGITIYPMNEALGNNEKLVICGIQFKNSKVSTGIGENSSNIYSTKNTVDMMLTDCYFTADSSLTDAMLYFYKFSAGTAFTANVRVTLDRSYVRMDESYTKNFGSGYFGGVDVNNCVFDIQNKAAAFYIKPVTAASNTNVISLEYKCQNSYVKYGIFKLAFDTGTIGLNSENRNGITFEIKNNTFADANNLLNIVAHDTATENVNMAAITDIIVTNNTVSGSGDLLTGYGSDYAMRKVNVANNSFKGFATYATPAFTGFADNADFTNNYYRNSDGDVISANVASGKVTDVALKVDSNGKCVAWASDYTITGTDAEFAASLPNVIDWTPAGLDVYGAMAGSTYYATSIDEYAAVDTVKNGFDFASDNVSFVSLTLEDGTEIESFADVSDVVLKLTAYHETVQKYLDYYFVVGDVGRTLLAETDFAGRTYWDPDVSDLADGSKVSYQLDTDNNGELETIVFTVGTDVFATIYEIPADKNKVRDIYMFAKEYKNVKDGDFTSAYNRDNTINFYGAQAGVPAVAVDENGIPSGKSEARSVLAKETVWYNTVDFSFGYQTNVTIDGITVAGNFEVNENSGRSTAANVEGIPSTRYTGEVKLLNCATDDDRPITNRDGVVTSTGNMPTNITVENCYLISSATDGYVIGIEGTTSSKIQIANVFVNNNYVRTADGKDFISVAGGSNLDESRYDGLAITITNNNVDGGIMIGGLSSSDDGYPNVTISNNIFDNHGKYVDAYITLDDDSYGNIQSAVISDNTFTVNGGNVNYAIKNTSVTTADASVGNVFTGFVYNFGDAELGTVPAVAYASGVALPVILSGENGVAKMGETDATYKSETAKIENALTCQTVETDGTTGAMSATDIAQNGVYTFITNDNMFVKVTDSTGTVYYNALPITGNDAVTVTAELCSIDGTVVDGQTCTVTIYNDPFTVGIEAGSELDATAGTYTTSWKGSIAGTGTLKAEEILGRWDFTVLDYGMYYGMTEDAVSDASIAKYSTTHEKVDATVGRTAVLADAEGTIVGTKESYDNSEAGLSHVYLKYSFNMNGADSGERWGRMYMTVQVGEGVYTFYSDAVGVTNASTAG